MTQPTTSNQATDLMGYLIGQRKHVLGILENLPEEAMRRPVLPSGWTCAGLVQHLALDVGALPDLTPSGVVQRPAACGTE